MTTVLSYEDHRSDLRGWLVYDRVERPLAAGGCRVQPGLDVTELGRLAQRMTLKQRVLGLNIDGAKCGLDHDPRSPDKDAALRGFVGFLRDELGSRFSMGPDMGTEWAELQQHARTVGVPSIKYAIATAQGLTNEEFFTRMARLDETVGPLAVSQRRAGHAVAHAVVGAARVIDVSGPLRCAVQGFGNLGRATALTLHEAGARVIAVADEFGTVTDSAGLDVVRMLADPTGTPVSQLGVGGRPEDIFAAPADVLVLAACADAMSMSQVMRCQFPAVVVGANCGLSAEAEQALYHCGVFVVPDFIGGIGGSASMEALFGPRQVPSGQEVLNTLTGIMRELIGQIAHTARRDGLTPRKAALDLAAAARIDTAAPPYGGCPYLSEAKL